MEAKSIRLAPRVAIALSTVLLAAVMLICIPQGQAQAVEADGAQATVQEFTGTLSTADDATVDAKATADAKQASGKKSKYGLLAKNGKLYPCNKKGKKLGKYWKVGSTVRTIYVAANAKKVPALSNIKYYYKSRFYVSNAVKAKVKTVKFLTKKNKSKVKTINPSAFNEHSYLTTIKNFNKTKVTSIGKYAFTGTKIKSVAFPKTLTTIGDYAFANCSKLSSLVGLQNTRLNSVGTGAFLHDSLITTISLPATCKTVKAYAFNDCTKLIKLYLPCKTKMAIGEDFIAGSSIDRGMSGAAIYVPAALYNAYYTDTGTEWPYYNKYLVKRG